MKTAILTLGAGGMQTAQKIKEELDADIYDKEVLAGNFGAKVAEIFGAYDALIFIMACGIVVRSIAPLIKDKRSDPAIVVVDEKGQFAISLLAGHLGGANSLAAKVAELTGGVPVITTATDLHQVTAFDLFAQKNDLAIENSKELKFISSELLNGGKVFFYTDQVVKGKFLGKVEYAIKGGEYDFAVALSNRLDIPLKAPKLLILRPRNLILGVGCKKGIKKEDLRKAVADFMQKNNRSYLSLFKAASIELKANEEGIVEFCKEAGLEFCPIATKEIKKAEGQFSASIFVQKTVGVGSVAEACAVLAGNQAKLIANKTVYPGITLALAEEERVYYL